MENNNLNHERAEKQKSISGEPYLYTSDLTRIVRVVGDHESIKVSFSVFFHGSIAEITLFIISRAV